MSEIEPQFVRDDNGLLIVNAWKPLDPLANESQSEAIGIIAELDGVKIDENNDQTVITTDITHAFGAELQRSGEPQLTTKFVCLLSHILTKQKLEVEIAEGLVDPIVTLSNVSPTSLRAHIYPHFQRWLNHGELAELAFSTTLSLAAPFGNEVVKKAASDFDTFEFEGHFRGGKSPFNIVTGNEQFHIHKLDGTAESAITELKTHVTWRALNLSTSGNGGTGLQVSGQERDNVRLKSRHSSLYTMREYNVDDARRTLSLILGLGTLTNAAAQYEGREDIFEDTQWTISSEAEHGSAVAKLLTMRYAR